MTQPHTPTTNMATGDAGGDAASTPPHSPANSTGGSPDGNAPGANSAGTVGTGSNGEVRLKLFARTDVGQVREHNEDNFLVADITRKSRGLTGFTTVGPQGAVFAVCDGMGGAAAGEIASQLAVDIICETMVDNADEKIVVKRDDLARKLVRAVEAAGLRIFQEARIDRTRRGMGTTVTAAALLDDHLFLAQVGDSRGYILRGDSLTQVTRDQSLVNQLIEAGQLTEEEAETFEHNNIILQALGTSDTVQVDLTYVELHQGDMLLLCSDGLSGMVRFDEIRETLKSSPEPLDVCKALTERANQAGGHDNITVIVVQFDGTGLKSLTPETEPLKYRKYTLPEESLDATDPNRRTSMRDMGLPPHGASSLESYSAIPFASSAKSGTTGDSATNPSVRPPPSARASAGAIGTSPKDGVRTDAIVAAIPAEQEDRISIPGTHVPKWVAIALVVGVASLIGAMAFLLLR